MLVRTSGLFQLILWLLLLLLLSSAAGSCCRSCSDPHLLCRFPALTKSEPVSCVALSTCKAEPASLPLLLHCCAAQPNKCCCAQPTTGNFTAFSAAAFISLTKNCCRHKVDAAWESEQSRFTISIGILISRDPLADRVLIEASMVSHVRDGGVCVGGVAWSHQSCLSTFPAHVLTRGCWQLWRVWVM